MPKRRGRGGKRVCNAKRKVVKTSQIDDSSILVSSVLCDRNVPSQSCESVSCTQVVPFQSVTSVPCTQIDSRESVTSAPCTQSTISVPGTQIAPCQSVTSVTGTSQVSNSTVNSTNHNPAVRIVPFSNGFGVIPLTGNSVINITVTDINTSTVNEITTSGSSASAQNGTVTTLSCNRGQNAESYRLTTSITSSSDGNVEMQDLTRPSTSNQQSFTLPEQVVNEEEEKKPDNVSTLSECEEESEVESSQPIQNTCSGSIENPECPVCLQPSVLPVRLPCTHIFCFLCVKGVALSGQVCPMCRAPVPFYYRNNPPLLSVASSSYQKCCDVKEKTKDEEKYFWFYEGRQGGWWQFEERMSDEIDENHNNGRTKFDMIICGQLYTIDTISCVQHPKHLPFRLRKIVRDLPSRIYRKGVAGILQRDLPSTSKQ